ncbi:MAG: DUF72 domain-containing protein [Candidatus Bathyarchaeia archaeon]
MVETFIGAGGWSYFDSGKRDRLSAYAERFNFVEVNSTFYDIPRPSTVRSWRRVPRGIAFSLKCHYSATHVNELRPVDETFKTLRIMGEICRLLGAHFLVIQTPSWIEYDEAKMRDLRNLFSSIDLGTSIAWEARTPGDKPIPEVLLRLMEDLDITVVNDLSRDEPMRGSSVLYSRLFSMPSQVEYEEETLETIHSRVEKAGPAKAYLAFHGVRMYRDAENYRRLYG